MTSLTTHRWLLGAGDAVGTDGAHGGDQLVGTAEAGRVEGLGVEGVRQLTLELTT